MKNKAGYTLIEILIASTIFVSVVGMGIATYTSASGFQSKSAVIRETNQSARYVMDTVVKDIRTADITGINYDADNILNNFSFLQNAAYNSILQTRTADPAQLNFLTIFRKGSGNCSAFINQIVYYQVDRGAGHYTIYRRSRHFAFSDYSTTIAVPSECGENSEDFLPKSVELADQNAASFSVSGIDPRIVRNANTGNMEGATESAYVKLNFRFKVANSDENSTEESRVIELKTTVVPRLLPL